MTDETQLQGEAERADAVRPVVIRALTILAAVAALAVSAAPAWAATPDAAKGACAVRGFMDYTDDSCMAKPRSGSVPPGLLSADHEI